MSGPRQQNIAEATDEALLVQAASGDEGAFMALYDRYAPRIMGLLVKIMRNRTDAEDALQVVAIDIWRRASAYDPALGSAQTWLLMVARARAIDAVRKRARTPSAVGDLVEGERAAPQSPSANHGSERVEQALASLPIDQRTPIDLAFYRGLTREQIAHTLGIPVGTVKTRIRIGVQHLARTLGQAQGRGA